MSAASLLPSSQHSSHSCIEMSRLFLLQEAGWRQTTKLDDPRFTVFMRELVTRNESWVKIRQRKSFGHRVFVFLTLFCFSFLVEHLRHMEWEDPLKNRGATGLLRAFVCQ